MRQPFHRQSRSGRADSPQAQQLRHGHFQTERFRAILLAPDQQVDSPYLPLGAARRAMAAKGLQGKGHPGRIPRFQRLPPSGSGNRRRVPIVRQGEADRQRAPG